MPTNQGQVRLQEIAQQLLRHWWIFFAAIGLGLAGARIALDRIPETFEATTKILVSPQRVPQEFVRSTVTDDLSTRIAALQDAVLSRPYLEKLIARTFGTPGSEIELEHLMRSIRSRVQVSVSGFNMSRSDASAYFELSFQDGQPDRAARVANLLAELYIEENSRLRSTRAGETVETLELLAKQVRDELEKRDNEIAAFKGAHLYELGSQLEANIRLLESRQRDLDTIQKTIDTARDKLESLQAAERRPTVPGEPKREEGTTPREIVFLQQLQREYDTLRATYTEQHPLVQAKQRQIDEATQAVAKLPPARPPRDNDATLGAEVGGELSAVQQAERDIARLEETARKLRDDIAVYRARIESTPKVDVRLGELTKGYDVLLKQFQEYQGKVQAAKGAQTLEAAQQGERFQVIEAASPPALPIAPQPLQIVAIGLIAGLALFVAPIVLREFVAPIVRSEAGLAMATEIPVLSCIPQLPTAPVLRSKRRQLVTNLLLASASLVALAVSFLLVR